MERQKTDSVARGFHQQACSDYQEIFNHVVKPTTIHPILSLAISLNVLFINRMLKLLFLMGISLRWLT